MPNRKNSGAEFDPMGVAPAMMQCWRVAMFDMPMACALEMNACMTRLIGHQQTFMRSLVQSRNLDDVATAQKKLVEEALVDAGKNSVAFRRDMRATLESIRLD